MKAVVSIGEEFQIDIAFTMDVFVFFDQGKNHINTDSTCRI